MPAQTQDQLLYVPTKDVKPDPNQPRRDFDPEGEHAWLVESIRQHGIIQPIAVRPNGNGYIVVAGERRLKAAQEAKLTEVPVVVRDRDGDNALVLAVVENVVRQDLNPVEEGDAYRALRDEGRTSEEIAALVNRRVERVSDRLALAALPAIARQAVMDGEPLAAMRQLSKIAAADAPLGEALAFGAAAGAYNWRDLYEPWRCLWNYFRADLGVKVVDCKTCNAIGSLTVDGKAFESEDAFQDADSDQTCTDCQGEGRVTVVDKKAPKPPAFFAMPVGGFHGMQVAVELMVDQLDQAAKDRIAAASTKANEFYGSKSDKAYFDKPPVPGLVGDAVKLAAESTVGVAVDLGNRTLVVVSPEFVSEWLPAIYEADVEEYVNPPKKAAASRASGQEKEQAQADTERERRAAERAEQAEARATARQFNYDLGAALAQIGEVAVTTPVMKLLVAQIIGETRRSDYNGRSGEGHAMFHRFTAGDWPTKKSGDPVIPRKPQDRREYAEKVDKRVDRELAAAKTPEQALAVLVRYLGHGLANLRGLPQADLEGALPYRSHGFRSTISKLLPTGVRKRVPPSNGVEGRSQVWESD